MIRFKFLKSSPVNCAEKGLEGQLDGDTERPWPRPRETWWPRVRWQWQ